MMNNSLIQNEISNNIERCTTAFKQLGSALLEIKKKGQNDKLSKPRK